MQTNVADMQQSLRVAQYDSCALIRMAGRGGLPLGNLPTAGGGGRQQRGGRHAQIGDATPPKVVPGTDVLTVRGVFSTPIYQVKTADDAAFTLTPPVAPTGRHGPALDIKTPTGIPQDLTALKDAVDKQRPEALLLVGSQGSDVWAVVELDPSNSNVSNPNQFTIGFKMSAGTHTADYAKSSSAGPGVFPPELKAASFVGLLEEYRFYVRREHAIAGDKTSDLAPKLSRARVYPGTRPSGTRDDANWRTDIADNIFDFQVALGLDTLAKDPTAGACAAGTIRSDDEALRHLRIGGRRGGRLDVQRRGDHRLGALRRLQRSTTSGSQRSPGPIAATRTTSRRRWCGWRTTSTTSPRRRRSTPTRSACTAAASCAP